MNALVKSYRFLLALKIAFFAKFLYYSFIFPCLINIRKESKGITQAVMPSLFLIKYMVCNAACALIVCYGNLYKLYENPLWAIYIAIFFECESPFLHRGKNYFA